jgi:thymidylate synthase (FAD)
MRIEVLDHGYVELVESWGSDERIIEAARMSTQKGFNGWGTEESPGDERLLAFLYRNNHATPFEMGGLIVEVQAPIFVFREWHRHRTQSYNEASARYAPLPALDYVPTVERCQRNSKANRQAGTVEGAPDVTAGETERWLASVESHYRAAEALLQNGLALGIPKELARVVMPVGRYSKMRASANLRNWLGFLTLRMAPNAQWEIQQYANAVGQLVADRFPRTWELFHA